MADIVYCYNHEVYFNLTNKCPCNCTFCIRNNGDSVGSAKTLWFEKEPTMALMRLIFPVTRKLFSAGTGSRLWH